MTPKTRVKNAARSLVAPDLLAHVTPAAQQQLAELRAQLLEAMKLTPADRVRNVLHALDELRPQMTTFGQQVLGQLRGELADAATELDEA